MNTFRNQGRIGFRIRVLEDPSRDVAAAAAISSGLDTGAKRPTTWMRRVAGLTNRVDVTPVGQTPKFEGRACCFDHLSRFEHTGRIDAGLQTTCPECGRRFVYELAAVR